MFYKISKFFLYLSLFTPLLLVKTMFFPFIAGKAMFFRLSIELSLLFFLFHILAHLQQTGFLEKLIKKLKNPIVICVALFAVAIVITALLGVNPTQSFWSNFERGDGAFQILHYFIFFVLSVVLLTDKESLERVLVLNVMISLPISIYAFLQMITPSNANSSVIIAPGDRVSGTLGNPSYLAAYLIFILIFIGYFLVVRRSEIKNYLTLLLATPAVGGLILFLGLRDWGSGGPEANLILNRAFGFGALWYIGIATVLFLLSTIDKKWFQVITLYALAAISLFTLLKTGTRGAFLAIIGGLLVIAAINFLITKAKKVRLILGIVFVGIIGLSTVFFLTHKAPLWAHVPVLNRLVNFTSATTDIKPRLWTWGSGLAATLEKPIAGWGVEGFATPFDKYYNPNHYGIESFFDRTHNIFLEYSVSGGLLVLLPWLAIFYFYFRKLNKRPKDVWYSILFAAPIMYLIQGFFLFDTLPIYIIFFVFLAFFINSESEELHLSPNPDVTLRGVNLATAGLLVAAFGILMHQTLFLPLQKNNLLVEALIKQSSLSASAGTAQATTPAQVVDSFHVALNAKSPIGQEETIGSYEKFVLSLVENASQNSELTNNPQVQKEVRRIVDDANRWYDENQAILPGLKQQYINGGLNLRAGVSFGQTELLTRGKKQFTDALKISPTRLEFIGVLIQLAKVQGDKEALEEWGKKAELYRPDIFKLADLKK